MKVILVLCAVLAVTVSISERRKSPGIVSSSIENCLKDLIKKTGQKHPGMKKWLATYQHEGFELLDEYFECQSKHALSKIVCLQNLSRAANSFKAKLDRTIPKGCGKHMNELMANGKECFA